MYFFFKNWKILMLGMLLVLAIAYISLFSASNKKQTPSGGNIPIPFFNNQQPTPFTSQLQITQTEPADKQQDTAITIPIAITFSRVVDEKEKLTIKFSLTPEASGSSSWSKDNTQFFFAPTALQKQTTYTATIVYGNTSTSWTFTTGDIVPTRAPEVQQGLDIQTTLDQQWTKMQQDLQTTYPWTTQLPLSTSDYFLSFDTATKTLYADLFVANTADILTINQLKQTVLTKLQEIGVNITKTTIEWTINQQITPTP